MARVAYVLLNLFILSTALRCNSDAQANWHIRNLTYTAGFLATVLVSIALYIALTFRNPGFIPVAQGVRQQVSTRQHHPNGALWLVLIRKCRKREPTPIAMSELLEVCAERSK